MRVTTERVGDNGKFKPLVRDASKVRRVVKVLADGAYDCKANYNHLTEQGVEAVIPVRRNWSGKSGGRMARKSSAQEQRTDLKGWMRRHGYGYRLSVENAFSTIKRIFGEYVTAKKFLHMVKELQLKISLYNLLTSLTTPTTRTI